MKHLDDAFCLASAVSLYQEGLLFLIRNPHFAAEMVKMIDSDRLWLECCRPMPEEREALLWETVQTLGLPIVATTNVFYSRPEDSETHRLITAVRKNCLLRDIPPLPSGAIYHLPSMAEIESLFTDCPEAIDETVRIAERCQFKPELNNPVFPSVKNAKEILAQRASEGAMKRFKTLTPEISERLEHELEVIIEMGFADYFLIVADIVGYARTLETPVATRGSGANSLVAYCLDITNVDPIRYNLCFARFLNRGRQDYPDIDLDFCQQTRDAVIDYVFERYGHSHVAMISTLSTMGARTAFRLTAKAMAIPNKAISGIQRVLSTAQPQDLEDPLYAGWERIDIPRQQIIELIAMSKLLTDKPHHLSLHPGGVVITPGPITEHVPLERAAKGVIVTQFDKESARKAGLIKIDLLGNRSLSTAGEAIRLITDRHGLRLDVESLCETDDATSKLLEQGDTIGVGQLESPSVRRLIRQLKTRTTGDIMQALALIRPGAAALGMKETFIRRARKLEVTPHIAPALDPILREAHGIMLFEDDALHVAGALAGLDPAEADRFRKRVSRCTTDAERKSLSKEFLGLCRTHGTDLSIAEHLWVQMAKFNEYSFCRAHAASYARLAWLNCYVKVHYPVEFWVAVLNNNEGLYDKWVYIEEAKRGVSVLGPCLNRSESLCVPEDNAIRLGLSQIRGLRNKTKESICRFRPFSGVESLIEACHPNRTEVENLILCGALDFTGKERSELLHLAAQHLSNASTHTSQSEEPPTVPTSHSEWFRMEWEILGLSLGIHPIAPFRPFLTTQGFIQSHALSESVGKTVSLCGVPATSRSIKTKEGQAICFFTLSDENGLFEVNVSTALYEKEKLTLVESGQGVLYLRGIPREHHDAVTVQAKEIGPLEDFINSNLHGSSAA